MAELPSVTGYHLLLPDRGGRVDWHPTDENLVAFDAWGNDGRHDVYVARPDGTEIRCLTEGVAGLPQFENGNPDWHPGGEWIAFQSEEPDHYNMQDRWPPYPGIGSYANLWVISVKTGKAVKLTDFKPYKSTKDTGSFAGVHTVLHPHFNEDGTKILWTMRYGDHPGAQWGIWKVVMAEFVFDGDGTPRLENVRDAIKPEGPGWYVESMGFRPGNDDEIALVANLEGFNEYGMDVYRYNVKTGEWKNLTNAPDYWDEDLAYTHDGKHIMWMSNRDFNKLDPSKPWTGQAVQREYYIMNADDGSDVRQVTRFNTPGAVEFLGKRGYPWDVSFSPKGDRLICGLTIDTAPAPDSWRPSLRIGVLEFSSPF